MNVGKEPALIIAAVVAVLTAVQQVLPVTSAAHGVIAAVLVVAGGFGIRSQVSPTP